MSPKFSWPSTLVSAAFSACCSASHLLEPKSIGVSVMLPDLSITSMTTAVVNLACTVVAPQVPTKPAN